MMNLQAVLRRIRDLAGDPNQDADALLLERFVDRGDGSAFAEIVRRHGGMVLGVCRRAARDEHRAEDAFQATFVLLAVKAASIANRASLASWLYGVAWRTARRAQVQARHRRETSMAHDIATAAQTALDSDISSILDEELQSLPEQFRAPVVLHYLEGRTKEETAHCLGVNVGTVSSRLARGRDKLRERLARRGLALSAAIVASSLQDLRASTPDHLCTNAVRTALDWARETGGQAAGISPAVRSLVEGGLSEMSRSNIKTALIGILCLAVLGGAIGLIANGQATPKSKDTSADPEKEGRVAERPYRPFVEWSGPDSKIDKETFHRIRSRTEWEEVWMKHGGRSRPDVNFRECMVIAIFDGKGWNSRGLFVASVITEKDRIVIRYGSRTYQTAGPGGGGEVVYPYVLALLPRSDKAIVCERDVHRMIDDPPDWKERHRFDAISGPTAAEKAALKQLQGTWHMSTVEMEGAANPWVKGYDVTIQGKYATISHRGNGDEYEIRLDPEKGTIDLIGVNGMADRKLGIYSLKDDDLRWCVHPTERPKDFKTGQDDGRQSWTFKRVKPAK